MARQPRGATLGEVIDAIRNEAPLHAEADLSSLSPLQRADHEASKHEWETALRWYSMASKPLSQSVKAKMGFGHVLLGELKEAAELLTAQNVGDHPVARAALVRILVRDGRGFGKRTDDLARGKALLAELLADKAPPIYVFATALETSRLTLSSDEALSAAKRGLELYPEWDFGAIRLVRLLLLQGLDDPAALERAIQVVPRIDDPVELADVFSYAMFLRHSSGMDLVIERLSRLPIEEGTAPAQVASQLEVLRAARDLVSGSQQALEDALARMPVVGVTSGETQWELAKLRLAIALATGRDEAIHAAALRLKEVFASHRLPLWRDRLDDVHGAVEGLAWGYFRLLAGHIEISRHRDRILDLFRDWDAEVLAAMFDLDQALHEGDEASIERLTSAHQFLPAWALSTVSGALRNSDQPDFEAVGEVLACLGDAVERARADGDKDAAAKLYTDLREDLESFDVEGLAALANGVRIHLREASEEVTGAVILELLGPKLFDARQTLALDTVAMEVEQRTGSALSMFYLALAAELGSKPDLAIERYERTIERDRDHASAMWNLAQLYAQRGNARGLSQLDKRLRVLTTKHVHDDRLPGWSEKVAEMLARAEAGYIPPPTDPVDAELASYPAVGSRQWAPHELSLVEAVTLIALLRSGDIQYTNWTLPPLEKSPHRFESRKRLVGTLFNLVSKGIVGFAKSTPRQVFGFKDGMFSAYLHRVVWQLAPATLQLEREIRLLKREDWPEAWTAAARRLAIDLGTDDALVYFAHQLESLGLPVPPDQELADIIGTQLERVAIANVYYLAHKSARSVLEYKAKYPASQAQLAGRARNLLRENGERMIDQGWDTKYRRSKDSPPPSLMYEALMDVLTGWGERGFNEPIDSLPLE